MGTLDCRLNWYPKFYKQASLFVSLNILASILNIDRLVQTYRVQTCLTLILFNSRCEFMIYCLIPEST